MTGRGQERRVEEIKARLLQRYRESGVAPIVEEVLGNIVARLAYNYSQGEDYKIVGVEPGDPPELVDKVWRTKALFYHPDNQQTGNREAFERVAAAYARIKGEGR